ncbi:MAG TPA: hypothetical protein DC057_14395 [Spirochaetia bacterium]|nr:hypothetical protein [Spirochaetia bacterium]
MKKTNTQKSSKILTNLIEKSRQNSVSLPSKSKIPIIDNKIYYKDVDDYIAKNKDFKNAKVAMEIAEEAITLKSKVWYADQKGERNSVKFMGTLGTVLVTYKDAFLKISAEISQQLKSILGNKFENFFKEKRIIKLKETATDDQTITLLLNKLGEEKFLEIFDIEIVTVTNEDMDRKQFQLPEDARNLINQFKASLRV